MENKDIPNKDILLVLLEDASLGQRSSLEDFYKAKKFYTSTIIAIIGACFYLVKETNEIKIIIFLTSGLLVFILSRIGYNVIYSHYRSLLENIAILGKIQDLLRLDEAPYTSKKRWKGEGLVLTRHIESRNKNESSQKFVNENLKTGLLISSSRRFFYCLGGIGVFLFLISIYFFFTL